MRKRKSNPTPAFSEPLKVSVVDGEVVISGPEWVHAALEPDAARTSADRLAVAADQANNERSAIASKRVSGTKAKAEKPPRDE